MTALAILGGSSPFVIDLIDDLAALGPWQLRLHGRDRAALGAVATYAAHALRGDGSAVSATDDLAAALDGADVVLHQIRYGGLTGRDFDERLAASLGVAADETLGPSGLHSAIRMTPPLLQTAAAIRRWCPNAWVINLTNPLSCSTTLLSGAGLRAIGLCELPQATMRAACAALDLEPTQVEWEYVGLNHRGFIHALSHDGADLLAELPRRLGARTVGGLTGEEIGALGAIPLKYFRLFLDPAARPGEVGRAGIVADLRDRALAELRQHPTRRPQNLEARAMPWYGDAVVPMLRMIQGAEDQDHVVNVMTSDGLVREIRAHLHNGEVVARSVRAASGAVAAWMDRFEAHERALLAASLDPTTENLRAALRVDPMLSPERVEAATAAIERTVGATRSSRREPRAA